MKEDSDEGTHPVNIRAYRGEKLKSYFDVVELGTGKVRKPSKRDIPKPDRALNPLNSNKIVK